MVNKSSFQGRRNDAFTTSIMQDDTETDNDVDMVIQRMRNIGFYCERGSEPGTIVIDARDLYEVS